MCDGTPLELPDATTDRDGSRPCPCRVRQAFPGQNLGLGRCEREPAAVITREPQRAQHPGCTRRMCSAWRAFNMYTFTYPLQAFALALKQKLAGGERLNVEWSNCSEDSRAEDCTVAVRYNFHRISMAVPCMIASRPFSAPQSRRAVFTISAPDRRRTSQPNPTTPAVACSVPADAVDYRRQPLKNRSTRPHASRRTCARSK
jgi:hypothetical protein